MGEFAPFGADSGGDDDAGSFREDVLEIDFALEAGGLALGLVYQDEKDDVGFFAYEVA